VYRPGCTGDRVNRCRREFSERVVESVATQTRHEPRRTLLRRVRQGFRRRSAMTLISSHLIQRASAANKSRRTRELRRPGADMLCGRPLTFDRSELTIGTAITPAVGDVHTNTGERTDQTDGREEEEDFA